MPKVLVVEDNEMNRDMISRRLERKGFEVFQAIDGEEGVQMAFDTDPDIILMDVSLPIIDGYEATKRIRANDNAKQIPIIALTAHALSGDREKALAAGCDEYDTKPVDFKRLLEKMNNLL